jgi:hypothetical protein
MLSFDVKYAKGQVKMSGNVKNIGTVSIFTSGGSLTLSTLTNAQLSTLTNAQLSTLTN